MIEILLEQQAKSIEDFIKRTGVDPKSLRSDLTDDQAKEVDGILELLISSIERAMA